MKSLKKLWHRQTHFLNLQLWQCCSIIQKSCTNRIQASTLWERALSWVHHVTPSHPLSLNYCCWTPVGPNTSVHYYIQCVKHRGPEGFQRNAALNRTCRVNGLCVCLWVCSYWGSRRLVVWHMDRQISAVQLHPWYTRRQHLCQASILPPLQTKPSDWPPGTMCMRVRWSVNYSNNPRPCPAHIYPPL